ncbi:hypothetical protein [Agromyces sp. LHK192]|uniref:hypothetical protein n=1 Tax=Agromyces sp. LHK192 TaxID=2498704 RepID=UPI000FD8A03D|nr:hypothetical protein [Agromyces sp. LHK192]
MSRMLRLSQQAVDPVGAISSRGITLIGATMATVFATGMTIWHVGDIVDPVAAAVGILLTVAAGTAAAVGTAPKLAPFTAERLGLVVILAIAAAIAEYLSTVGHNRYLFDDYGPAVIGLLLLSLAPFTTWSALAAAGLFSTGVLSVLVIGVVRTDGAVERPLAANVVVVVTAVLAFTAAAAAYSAVVVHGVLSWQREVNRDVLDRDRRMQAGLVPDDRLSRVSVLDREVLPFLVQVMTADRISVDDADRARELSESLHRALRAGIDSTWLDDLAGIVSDASGTPVTVVDHDRDARGFPDDHRAAVAALLRFLGDGGRCRAIEVLVERDDDEGGGMLVVEAVAGEHPASRRELGRFIAIAEAVGFRASATVDGERLSVSLAYRVE